MIRILLAAALTCFSAPALAQAWATADFCNVSQAELAAVDLGAPEFAAMHALATGIENGKARFWQVTSPGGAVSHLWGTTHSAALPVLDLPAALEEAIATARSVAVEIDFIFKNRAEIARAYRGEDRFRPLRSTYAFQAETREVTRWIRNRFVALGWQREAPDDLKLSAVVDVILGHPCYDFTYGTYPIQDSYIQLEAALSGARVVGLEPVERLAEVMDAPENEDLAQAILAVYGAGLNPDQEAKTRAIWMAAYLDDRIDLMMAMERQYLRAFYGPARADVLLAATDGYLVEARNRDFLEAMAPLLAEGGALIAVGAFHLPGETGLVALLRARGFSVSAIPTPQRRLFE